MFPVSRLLLRTNPIACRKAASRRRKRRPSLAFQPLEHRIALSCDGFLTYSQGGWSGAGEPGRYLDAEFSSVFPHGVQIGDQTTGAATGEDAAGSWAALFTSPAAIRNYLPNGGGSATLDGDSVDPVNPSGPTHGPGLTLGGQTLAMMLNLGFDAADPNFDGNPANPSLGSLIYTATDGTEALNGNSVSQIVAFANAYLSGADTTSYSGLTLTTALSNIILEYDNAAADGNPAVTLSCHSDCQDPEIVFVTETVVHLGAIGGRSFEDLNGDGDDEAGADPGLPWRITLIDLGPDGQAGSDDDVILAADAWTEGGGGYLFDDLAAGRYRVVAASDSGSTATTAVVFDLVLVSALVRTDVTTVTEACTTTIVTTQTYAIDRVFGNDFGRFRNVTLEGVKFQDHDGNGVQDAGEQPLSGWTIILNDDGDGVVSDGEVFAVTGSDGRYRFANLGPGVYTVAEATPPEHWVQTLGTYGYTVMVGDADGDGLRGAHEAWSGGIATGIDFGNAHVGSQHAKTIGFWSNKHGQAAITDADLAALRNLNLRRADGGDFDPASAADVKRFLVGAAGAKATNMANMLSAQFLATILNVRHGFLGESTSIVVTTELLTWSGNTLATRLGPDAFLSLLDHDGTSEADARGLINEYGFVSIERLIAAADEALGGDRLTVGSDSARAYQEALKIVFDAINNNLAIFVR